MDTVLITKELIKTSHATRKVVPSSLPGGDCVSSTVDATSASRTDASTRLRKVACASLTEAIVERYASGKVVSHSQPCGDCVSSTGDTPLAAAQRGVLRRWSEKAGCA
jgi:hypothetical protein